MVKFKVGDKVTPKPKPKPKPNLPRRGDLVKCRDLLWVVYSEGEDSDGEYRLASLTGDPRVSFVTLDELSWAGSVRKKIKRVKKEMEGES